VRSTPGLLPCVRVRSDDVHRTHVRIRCFSGSFGPEASDTYNLYLWARDDLPTYNSVEPYCDVDGDASDGLSICSDAEIGCDQAQVAAEEGLPTDGSVNWQAAPYFVLTIDNTLTGISNDSDIGISLHTPLLSPPFAARDFARMHRLL
jgi:hypothetical protein